MKKIFIIPIILLIIGLMASPVSADNPTAIIMTNGETGIQATDLGAYDITIYRVGATPLRVVGWCVPGFTGYKVLSNEVGRVEVNEIVDSDGHHMRIIMCESFGKPQQEYVLEDYESWVASVVRWLKVLNGQ